jgi:5S rRNA maturation endonuclease (ribonuclease M5)
MKFNPKLEAEIAKFKEYVIIVEGKKHVTLLNKLGFFRVYEIHVNGMTPIERIEEIKEKLEKRDKVCILTDLDKRGKNLYFELKAICTEFGIKLDSTLRGILLVGNINRLEELTDFINKATHEVKFKKNWEVR